MEFFATSLFEDQRKNIYCGISRFLSGEEIGEIAVVKLYFSFMSDGFFSKFFPHN